MVLVVVMVVVAAASTTRTMVASAATLVIVSFLPVEERDHCSSTLCTNCNHWIPLIIGHSYVHPTAFPLRERTIFKIPQDDKYDTQLIESNWLIGVIRCIAPVTVNRKRIR